MREGGIDVTVTPEATTLEQLTPGAIVRGVVPDAAVSAHFADRDRAFRLIVTGVGGVVARGV